MAQSYRIVPENGLTYVKKCGSRRVEQRLPYLYLLRTLFSSENTGLFPGKTGSQPETFGVNFG
jgi:hypothetical protein